MSETGTLQLVLTQIAAILRPLETLFAPNRAVGSFAQLDIAVTPAQAGQLGPPIQALTGAVAALLSKAGDLAAGIEAENNDQITTASMGLLENLVTAIESIDMLQDAATGLAIPDGNKFAERLFNLLMVTGLDTMRGVNETLEIMGVLVRTPFEVDGLEYSVANFDFGKLGQWLSSPVDAFESEYGWSSNAFQADKLLRRIGQLLVRLNVPIFIDSAANSPLDFVFFQLRPRSDLNPPGLGLSVLQSFSPGSVQVAVDDLAIGFDMDATLPFGMDVTFQPPSAIDVVTGTGSASGEFALTFAADRTSATEKYVILGEQGGSRLEFGRFGASLGMKIAPDGTITPAMRGDIGEGKLYVSMANADGFLGSLLSGLELESDFDIGFGYSGASGLFFEGSASLEIELPLHISLGPVDLSGLTFSVGIDGNRFPMMFALTIQAGLGPIAAVVEDIGIRADLVLSDQRDGNAGAVDFQLAFKPPNGVGLSVDAGPVSGGGYLFIDTEHGEYAGALELTLLDFLAINAVAVITTRMPDGSDGFSLIAVIGVEFNPGLQLGFGFTLIGLGGLLGLNRTMNLEALAEGVRTGAINSVVFPTDVVANAPRIISDMKAFFPPAQGIFLIGPMAKIGWGTPTLISLALGVIIEIPGNIAIVGVLKVALPHEDAPVLIIQVAFIGAIEFDKKRGWFFASLFDSRVLFMTLEGGMGVLVDFGDKPNFVLSVGGFHPAYKAPAMPFPTPARIAINILNTPVARVRVMAYFAVTSNTVQFGARAELYFGISIASIEGHIGFDALFQFSPFYFVITISASLSVKLFGAGLFSVRFRGELKGPTPWHIEGTGSISLLFWDVEVDFEHSWGESDSSTLPSIEVMKLVGDEFANIANWTAALPAANKLLVSLRSIDAGEDLVLHPLGSLRISQRAVPLGLTIDKVGSQKPSDANRFSVVPATTGLTRRGGTEESFAMAQFKAMSDAEKLSAADFENEESGLELAANGQQCRSSYVAKRVNRYETTIIDNIFIRTVIRFVPLLEGLFAHFLSRNAAAMSPLSAKRAGELQPFADAITVNQSGYVVALAADNSAVGNVATFASRARAQEHLAQLAGQDPKLAGQCHIIRPHEMKLAA
jgi:hypothetical protein